MPGRRTFPVTSTTTFAGAPEGGAAAASVAPFAWGVASAPLGVVRAVGATTS